jgi:transcription elongation factor B subunit 1
MADDGELDTVKLISADGHEFVVDRKAAMVSGTIKSMLSGPGKYLQDGRQSVRLHCQRHPTM